MYSPNAIRMEPRNGAVSIDRYNEVNSQERSCVPRKTNYFENILDHPEMMFESLDD